MLKISEASYLKQQKNFGIKSKVSFFDVWHKETLLTTTLIQLTKHSKHIKYQIIPAFRIMTFEKEMKLNKINITVTLR